MFEASTLGQAWNYKPYADFRSIRQRRWRMNKQLQQVGATHQIPIALTRRTTALIDCPDHKTLPPPTIPRREHAFDVRREPSMLGHNVRPRITLNPEILEQRLLRPGEPHRKQH